MRASISVPGALLVLFLAGCGGGETPEDRVRSYIDRVAEAAEARSWRSFGDFVTDDYSDDRQLSKQDVLAIIARYILANQHIHILERVASIQILDPQNAHAVVFAAMAGQPVSGPDELARISADVYRFEIDLRAGENGTFRTRRGDWRPVSPEQFLIGR
jgi:hypothetical protein